MDGYLVLVDVRRAGFERNGATAGRTIEDEEESVQQRPDQAVHCHDAPHVPHGWECGYLMETKTATLLCGDLFTQPGRGEKALTTDDILGPSEAFRKQNDYYAHGPNVREVLEGLAGEKPKVLACMHGSDWTGDGAGIIRALGEVVVGRELAIA